MAEALVKVMLETLNSLVQKEFGLVWGVNKEMEKLSSTLSTICAVLDDAEERQLADRAVKNWLQKLNDVCFELDDILDDCEMKASQFDYQGKKRRWIQKRFNPMNTSFHHKIAKRMKKIGDQLDQISNERLKFHLREVIGEKGTQVRESRQTSSIITQPHVYGREEDKEFIVGCLVNKVKDFKAIFVYPIVGIGGIGKTTLAQLVFNDEMVNEHFDLKIWVHVYDDFDLKRLMKAIIESATGEACEALMQIDPMQKRLQKVLKRKRFLLVLDDVWNEDQEQWDKLKHVLDCGANGASIVVTTRLKKVAYIMGTLSLMHHLSSLSEDDCWLLFKQRAFLNQREERPNLVKIGKEILKKCKGVPLAAKALGGLMCFKSEESEWLSVMQSKLWNLPEDNSSILPALRLSYLHLPVEQRRCFVYCATFPKNHEIDKEELIHLWMANGLISSKRGLEVEDIGNEIFTELYWRSFFQDVEKAYYDNEILNCKMHDLVHDLAQSLMEDECHIVDVNDDAHLVNLSKRVRHLTYNCDHSRSIKVGIPNAPFLRTFMVLNNHDHSITSCSYPLKPSSLRVFHSNFICPSISISSLISNLKHLRYLSLSGSDIKILPDSVCSLPHLSTLDLSFCHSLHKLPKHMSRLKSLRHLYIQNCENLSHLPPNIGELTCLKILTNFIANSEKGCHLDELRRLNIGGDLCISNLSKVADPMEAKSADLSGKGNLKALELCWNKNSHEYESQDNVEEQVLEALAPPPNLRSLRIYGYKGSCFPHWFCNEILGNVVRINLTNCRNCREFPPLGKLASLRDLDIFGMDFVQYMDEESCDGGDMGNIGFPRLESLFITDLSNLERFSRQEGKLMFPRLLMLQVRHCPKLTSLGLAFELLNVLNLEGTPNLEFSRQEGTEMFQCLSTLSVNKCPKIEFPTSLGLVRDLKVWETTEVLLKSISNLRGLTRLQICENDNVAFLPNCMLSNLTTLRSFRIHRFFKLQELPSDLLSGLNALEALEISCCRELEGLPEEIFRDSTSLKHLTLNSCKKLKSLSPSFRGLTALQSLKLVDCPELLDFPSGTLDHVSSLRDLTLSGMEMHLGTGDCFTFYLDDHPKLAVLPEALQHNLSSLEFMTISGFSELNSLPDWFGNLTSLRELRIDFCPDLTFLPSSFRRLSNLQKLTITSCPKLEKRCEKEVGEDWDKIAHIPEVRWLDPFDSFFSYI